VKAAAPIKLIKPINLRQAGMLSTRTGCIGLVSAR
jgi:hypothetical protein